MTPELRQTARHEAAHAVIGFIGGLRFRARGISIIPRKTGGRRSSGEVYFRASRRSEELLRAILAGPLYEFLLLPDKSSSSIAVHFTGLLGDAVHTASILTEIWNCQDSSPIRRATRLKDWSPLFTDIGRTVLLRIRSKEAQAASAFHNTFWQAICSSHLTTEQAKMFFAEVDRGWREIVKSDPALLKDYASMFADRNNDPRVFPFLHRLARETAQLLEKYRDTIEQLTTVLLTEGVLTGAEVESFLNDRHPQSYY